MKNIKILFLLLLIPPISMSYAAINQLGTLGVNFTPNARFLDEGSLAYALSNQKSFNRFSFIAQPYEWMEASLFYADIKNKEYPASFGSQSYKDKGFNIKLLLSKETDILPQLALGLTDFAGTGIFSGEFFVASKRINNLDLSLGVGWGMYAGKNNLNNPLITLNDNFKYRNYNFGETVGEFDFDDYFSGKKVSLFSSAVFSLDHRSKILFEYSPITDIERFDEVEKLSTLYLGYSYGGASYNFSIFYGNNDELNFILSANQNLSIISGPKYIKGNLKSKNNAAVFIDNLQRNNISLRDLATNEDKVFIGIRQNKYLNSRKSVMHTLQALADSGYDYKEVVVTNYSFGEPIITDQIETVSKEITPKKLLSNEKRENLFRSKEKFPNYLYSFSPGLKTFVASREAFLHQSLTLNFNLTSYFSEKLFLDADFSYSVYDNFKNLYLEPVDTYPAQVRSDIKKYLRGFSKGVNLERFELNYFAKAGDHYLAVKGGLFEEMFGGIGFEYLNLNRFSNFAYGIELFKAKKRDYEYDLSFQDYENLTGHLNLYHYYNELNLTTHLSWGEYLAGDEGFTVDISKRFNNGLKFGAFATFTDVTKEQYGEGSFNKGIYFSLPFNTFLGNGVTTDFNWTPLTKDPGQKLAHKYKLFNMIERYVY